jgi:hypothetical protein
MDGFNRYFLGVLTSTFIARDSVSFRHADECDLPSQIQPLFLPILNILELSSTVTETAKTA